MSGIILGPDTAKAFVEQARPVDVLLTADHQKAELHRATEEDAVTAICAAQRVAGDSVDPAGARRIVRALIAVGLLRFP
jgi:hypothetical protein